MSCWRVLEGTVLGRGSVSGYGGEGGGGDTGRGLGISRAEVYDWTLWQM